MEYTQFGKELSKLRREKLLTQEELGNRVGVGFRAVSKWERGITLPDITIISELANTLDVDRTYLLELCLGKTKTIDEDYNKKEKQSKINLHLEKNVNIYNNITQTKTENDHIMKQVGIGVLVEIIIISIANSLPIKKTISILITGILCISLSDIFNNKK